MEGARPATSDDLEQLAALCQAAVDELRPTRGGTLFCLREARPAPFGESLAAALDDPDQTVWAGTIDGVAVGYAVARVETLRDGTLLGILDDLFVEPGAREVAVGEAMIGAVLGWFRHRGCAGADAHALPGNRETKNFFERHGFSARLLVMHKRLAPGDPD